MLDIHYKVDDVVKTLVQKEVVSPTYMTFGLLIPAQLTIQHTLDTRNWFQKIIDGWQPLKWMVYTLAVFNPECRRLYRASKDHQRQE